MGLIHNGGGLITARFFLGVAEAGLFPGVNVRIFKLLGISDTNLLSIIFRVGTDGQNSVFVRQFSFQQQLSLVLSVVFSLRRFPTCMV
jgi:hypothetical protein